MLFNEKGSAVKDENPVVISCEDSDRFMVGRLPFQFSRLRYIRSECDEAMSF